MRNPAALSLYRRLLRLHRKVLPNELRTVGDKYLAQEFRAHRDVDDFAQISTFMREWADYAAQLSMQESTQAGRVGRHLTARDMGAMTKEQREMLDDMKRQAEAVGSGNKGGSD